LGATAGATAGGGTSSAGATGRAGNHGRVSRAVSGRSRGRGVDPRIRGRSARVCRRIGRGGRAEIDRRGSGTIGRAVRAAAAGHDRDRAVIDAQDGQEPVTALGTARRAARVQLPAGRIVAAHALVATPIAGHEQRALLHQAHTPRRVERGVVVRPDASLARLVQLIARAVRHVVALATARNAALAQGVVPGVLLDRHGAGLDDGLRQICRPLLAHDRDHVLLEGHAVDLTAMAAQHADVVRRSGGAVPTRAARARAGRDQRSVEQLHWQQRGNAN